MRLLAPAAVFLSLVGYVVGDLYHASWLSYPSKNLQFGLLLQGDGIILQIDSTLKLVNVTSVIVVSMSGVSPNIFQVSGWLQ